MGREVWEGEGVSLPAGKAQGTPCPPKPRLNDSVGQARLNDSVGQAWRRRKAQDRTNEDPIYVQLELKTQVQSYNKIGSRHWVIKVLRCKLPSINIAECISIRFIQHVE